MPLLIKDPDQNHAHAAADHFDTYGPDVVQVDASLLLDVVQEDARDEGESLRDHAEPSSSLHHMNTRLVEIGQEELM